MKLLSYRMLSLKKNDYILRLLTVCVTGRWGGRGLCLGKGKLEASLSWPDRPGKNACLHRAAGTGEIAQTPQRPVHAVLGVFCCARLAG